MLRVTDQGLFCAKGGFYIDPIKPVAHALLTHAHADHAQPGCKTYTSTPETLDITLARWKECSAERQPTNFGDSLAIGGVKVSFHSAGHVRGSSQIRIDDGKEVWVVSGDYKRGEDGSVAPFEVVPCDVFVTEATFALPVFQWPSLEETASEIVSWAKRKWSEGKVTVLYAYSLGKTQSLLHVLRHFDIPISLHVSAKEITKIYAQQGVDFPEYKIFDAASSLREQTECLHIMPPGMERSRIVKGTKNIASAFASGWMQLRGARRRRGIETGFIVSDHADFEQLTRTVKDIGPRKVYVTHGYNDVFARYVKDELKIDAEELTVLRSGEDDV